MLGLGQGRAVAQAVHSRINPVLLPAEETYTNLTQKCWDFFVEVMRNVTASELCEWKVISRYGLAGDTPGSPAGVWGALASSGDGPGGGSCMWGIFGGGIACGPSIPRATWWK